MERKMTGFPPGPYEVTKFASRDPEDDEKLQLTLVGSHGVIIARLDVWDGDENIAEMNANAALIAAAPDMYAALENVLAALRSGRRGDWLAVEEDADAALAKAKPV